MPGYYVCNLNRRSMKTKRVQLINDWAPEVKSVVHTIKSHGFTVVEATNGEETVKASAGHKAILDCLLACDEATLRVTKDGKRASFWLVMGNSPGELIADGSYQDGLEADWDKVLDEHCRRWEERTQPTRKGFYGYVGSTFQWIDRDEPVGTEVEVEA